MALIGADEFVKAWMIYLKDGTVVLSRRHYESWWEIQDEYGDRFKSNRAITEADPVGQIMRCLAADYKDGALPVDADAIHAFFARKAEVLEISDTL